VLAHRLHALPYAATLGYLDGIDDDLLGKNLLAGSVSIDPRDPCLYMYMLFASHQSIIPSHIAFKHKKIHFSKHIAWPAGTIHQMIEL